MPNTIEKTFEAMMHPATDLSKDGVEEIAEHLRHLLADVFTLFVKTKNFHWHMSGRHFRDYHRLLDDQSDQLYEMIDVVAERARKIGETSLRSISDIVKYQRLADNNDQAVHPQEMIAELCADNRALTMSLRVTHAICDRFDDTASASLIENWIDQAEGRTWFLSEIGRND